MADRETPQAQAGKGAGHVEARYFHALDGVRGVAALLIAIRHSLFFFAPSQFDESYLAVDLFFVLSGVVIANAYERRLEEGLSAGRFMQLRLIRLAPLYMLGGAIGLVAIVLTEPQRSATDLALMTLLYVAFIPNLFGPPGSTLFPSNGPAWSIFFELVANYFYALTRSWLTTPRLVVWCAIATIGLVFAVTRAGHLDLGWDQETLYGGFLRVGFSFFAGLLLFRVYRRRAHLRIRGDAGALVLVATLAILAAIMTAIPEDAVRPLYDVIVVVAIFPAIVFLLLFVELSGFLAAACAFMGAISYALYAIHQPVGVLVRHGLQMGGVNVTQYAPISGWVLIAVLIGACVSLDRLYDTPLRRWLSLRVFRAPKTRESK